MSKPFPLQTLLNLARDNSDRAAIQLGILNGRDRDMNQRLQQLLDYRDEYSSHLTRAIQNGMNSLDLQNYRQFIDKIDTAIDLQRENVSQAQHQVQDGQRHWRMQQQKLKSFDTLSTRHQSAEVKREAKREQKVQDEFAARSFLGTKQ